MADENGGKVLAPQSEIGGAAWLLFIVARNGLTAALVDAPSWLKMELQKCHVDCIHSALAMLEWSSGAGTPRTMTAFGHGPPPADLEHGIGHQCSQVDELIGRCHIFEYVMALHYRG